MWLQLVIQVIIPNESLEAQGSIHMSPEKDWDYINETRMKKIKKIKSKGSEIPTVSSQKSASAHILTEHTGGGWGQKWRHIFNLKSLKMSFLQRATKLRMRLCCCLTGTCRSAALSWRICRSSIRIGWFPVVFFYPQLYSLCFFLSPPLSLHSSVSPFDRILHSRVTNRLLEGHLRIYQNSMFLTCLKNYLMRHELVSAELFFLFFKSSDGAEGGRWSEGRRTADLCFCPGLALLELLTSLRLFF